MARPKRDDGKIYIRLRKDHGINYASSYEPYEENGKRKFRIINWGTVDDNLVFHPAINFILLSEEERARFVFPKDWDMSECEELLGKATVSKDAKTDNNLLYGDLFLLDGIAEKVGVIKALESTFESRPTFVNDILTLAEFPYVTGWTFNRALRWQRMVHCKATHTLTPDFITRFTQSITERDRMEFLRQWGKNFKEGEFFAVDTTTRSAYGDRKNLCDIHKGKNKDHVKLKSTVEVVVYSVESHLPAYYRTFPGGTNDSRILETIVNDLSAAGFPNVLLITDRGFESLRNLELLIEKGQPFITASKTKGNRIYPEIEKLGSHPEDNPGLMSFDKENGVFYKQIPLEYAVKGKDGEIHEAKNLMINLFYNPVMRAEATVVLNAAIQEEEETIRQDIEDNITIPLEERKKYIKKFHYFNITLTAEGKLASYTKADEKIKKEYNLAGYFAFTSHNIKKTAPEILEMYKKREEQEEYFDQMKSLMVSRMQNNWTNDGKTGRLLILFVSLILSSQVKFVWKDKLEDSYFKSSLDVLDEMRPIRFVEAKNFKSYITPFSKIQIQITEAFGLKVPEGCGLLYKSRQKKVGRPVVVKEEDDN